MRFPAIFSLGLLALVSCSSDPEPKQNGDGGETAKQRPAVVVPKDNVRASKNAWDLAAGIHEVRLENGLTVLIRESHSAPIVTCELAFKVGAVDERDDERGLAHFLEHMLFKGSTSFKKGEIDRFTAKNGGQNNAYTSRDMTAYHFTMPSTGLGAALKILKEMLGEATLDEKEFTAEKGPVLEELHSGSDNPWNRLWERTQSLVYHEHPYQHPIIGYEYQIHNMSQAQMKRFYDTYYRATNAVLTIVGDVDATATIAQVAELFGGIAKGTPVPPMEITEPEQRGIIRHEVEEDVEVDRLIIAWRGPIAGNADDIALDIASSILGTGRTSRLNQRLVEKDQLSSGIGTSNYSGRFPGTFTVEVEALPGAKRAAIEAAVAEELARLAKDGPTESELEKARNGTIAGFIFGAESTERQADLIARYACTLSLDDLSTYVEKITKVTAADVKAAMAKYFRRETSTVCWSIARGKSGGGGDDDDKGGGGKRWEMPRRSWKDGGAAGAASGGASIASTKRLVLDNGLIVLLLENHTLPVFAVQSYSRSSQIYESEDEAGLANLVGACLEDGTESLTAEQIAEKIEFVGGTLRTSAAGVGLKVLAKDRALALDLLFDILTHSNFPEAMVEQRKQIILSEIAGRQEQPLDLARYAFAEGIYGRHPLHRPADGYADTVASLTRDACAAHFRKYFIPNNTVVAIVGDFNSAEIEASVRKISAGWKMQLLDFPGFPEAVRADKPVLKVLTLPNSKQVNTFVGHLGVRRSDPDYFPLLVMDHVLGTGSGFTDRLSQKIRDENGLAYWVTGQISGSAGMEPGMFRCGFGAEPNQAKVDKAMEILNSEVARIRQEEVTADELDTARNYLCGSFTFLFETSSETAEMLIMIERYGLGFDYTQKFPERVREVTPAEILRVAKKHLDPSVLLTVMAGPLDEKGRVLKKK